MQNLNQFGQTVEVGELDLVANGNASVFTVKLNPDYAGTGMVPGEGAKLVDLGASDIKGINPIVGARALATDKVFGVKVSNTKKNTADKGDIMQVAGAGSVMWLNAGAAILRGADVELVVGTPGNVITNAAGTILGECLDKATAADQLVRILIK